MSEKKWGKPVTVSLREELYGVQINEDLVIVAANRTDWGQVDPFYIMVTSVTEWEKLAKHIKDRPMQRMTLKTENWKIRLGSYVSLKEVDEKLDVEALLKKVYRNYTTGLLQLTSSVTYQPPIRALTHPVE